MINMKLTRDEAKDQIACEPGEGPAYPWGLCLYLDDDVLQKLGMTALPDVGTRLMLHAVVEVTSNSQRQTQEGKTVSMDLQITDMDLKPEQGPSAASLLYGG